MAGRHQQRWRRPLRREQAGQQLWLKLEPGPRGGSSGVGGGGPELELDPGWPPPPPRRGEGMGWDVMAGWGERAEGGRIQTPEDAHHKGRGSWCPAGPGTTGLEEQHSRTTGNMPPDPVANQRPRPFCPRGGRTRVKPCCGGRGGEIRGQALRPPSQTIASWSQIPSEIPELEERVDCKSPIYNRLLLQPKGTGVGVGMLLSIGLIPVSTVPGLGHIPLD